MARLLVPTCAIALTTLICFVPAPAPSAPLKKEPIDVVAGHGTPAGYLTLSTGLAPDRDRAVDDDIEADRPDGATANAVVSDQRRGDTPGCLESFPRYQSFGGCGPGGLPEVGEIWDFEDPEHGLQCWEVQDLTERYAGEFTTNFNLYPLSGLRSVWFGSSNGTYQGYGGQTTAGAGGRGYGNTARVRLVSPLFEWNGTHDIDLDFLFWNDTEPGFDFVRVLLVRAGSGTETPLNGAGFTGAIGTVHGEDSPPLGESASYTLTAAEFGGETEFRIVFEFLSDLSWSDEDGLFDTVHGPFSADDISLSGGLVGGPELFDFETGLQGWTNQQIPGLGNLVATADVSEFPGLPGECQLSGKVLAPHPPDSTFVEGQKIRLVSPPFVFDGDPAIAHAQRRLLFAEFEAFLDLPLEAGVLYNVGWVGYPALHDEHELEGWSPVISDGFFEYTTSAFCNSSRHDLSEDIYAFAQFDDFDYTFALDLLDSVRLVIDIVADCEPWDEPSCTFDGSGFSPLFDDVRFRMLELAPHYRLAQDYGGIAAGLQPAIDAAADGDTILIVPDFYGQRLQGHETVVVSEYPQNWCDIDLGSKNLVIASPEESFIACWEFDHHFRIEGGQSSSTVLSGLSLLDSEVAVECTNGSSPVLCDLWIESKYARLPSQPGWSDPVGVRSTSASPILDGLGVEDVARSVETTGGSPTVRGGVLHAPMFVMDSPSTQIEGTTLQAADSLVVVNSTCLLSDCDIANAVFIESGSDVTFVGCDLNGYNHESRFDGSSVTFQQTIYEGSRGWEVLNGATVEAIACTLITRQDGAEAFITVRGPGTHAHFDGTVLYDPVGGGNPWDDAIGIHVDQGATVDLEQSTVTGVRGHGAKVEDGSGLDLDRSIVWGNSAIGLWVEGTAQVTCSILDSWRGYGDLDFVGDNLFEPPGFCEPLVGNVSVKPWSPALPSNNPCGLLIGAGGAGCTDEILSVPLDFPSIQEAIDAAVDGDTIEVSPGQYSESLRTGRKKLVVRSTGGAASTQLTGSHVVGTGKGSELRGFTLTPPSGSILLINDFYFGLAPSNYLKLRECVVEGTDTPDEAMIYWVGWGSSGFGELELDDCVFRNNGCKTLLNIDQPEGKVEVRDCRFEDNIYGEQWWSTQSLLDFLDCQDVLIERSDFTGNTARDCDWEGQPSTEIIHFSGGELTMRNSIVVGNEGTGIRGSNCTLEDVVIQDNAAGDCGEAGGLDIHNGILRRCTISGNSANQGVGGLRAYNVTVEDCLITGNSGQSAGGILARGGALDLVGSTIAGNRCVESGGGLEILASSAEVERSIIWGNCADGDGDEVWVETGVHFSCSDVGADVAGGGSATYEDSFSQDPLFCGPISCQGAPASGGDYSLDGASPCLPAANSCGLLIGAVGFGCGEDPGGEVIHVPGDYATIQPALDAAAPGDTVAVAPGTYAGTGNFWLDFGGKDLVLLAPAGPDSTILDGSGTTSPIRFTVGGETREAVIEGFTICNGFNAGSGGAMQLGSGSSPTIRRCVIKGSRADSRGGGVFLNLNSHPLFEECSIAGNSCGQLGGGVCGQGGSSPVFDRTVLWGNCAEQDAPDYYGTTGGWTFECSVLDSAGAHGGITIDYTADNTFGQDPLFCNPADCFGAPTSAGDYHVNAGSVCLAPNNPCGQDIGASGSGCAGTPVVRHVPSQYSTIQAAIAASASGDTVLVAAGAYTGAGNREIDFLGLDVVVVSSEGAAQTIVDCEGATRGFVFQSGETPNAVLDGFTVINGYGISGGGILCTNGSSPTVRNCTFESCTADGGNGGGIAVEAGAGPAIAECMFRSNEAQNGGGLSWYSDRLLELRRCQFRENVAYPPFGGGGGLSVECLAESGTLVIEDCEFVENSVQGDGGGGGGIYCFALGPVLVQACSVAGNTVAVDGNAYGGGVWIVSTSSEATIFDGCLIAGNEVRNVAPVECHGGGLTVLGSGPLEVRGCTIADNVSTSQGSAAEGGGIAEFGAGTVLMRTVLWNNCADDQGSTAILGGDLQFVCSDVDSAGVLAGGVAFYDPDCLFVDPLFCAPTDCGSAPQDSLGLYTIQAGSPCLASESPCGVLIGAFGEGCGEEPGGEVIHVPGDYATIQPALDAAAPGDTVAVAPGTYAGTGNFWLDFGGKDLVLLAPAGPDSTILDGSGTTSPIRFTVGGETREAVIEGFTICNGFNAGSGGAMQLGSGSSPTIRRCVIKGSRADSRGGGVFLNLNSHPLFEECSIAGNSCGQLGGGVCGQGGSSPVFDRTVLWGNCAEQDAPDYYGTTGSWTFQCSVLDSAGTHGGVTIDYSAGDNTFGQDPLFCQPEPCTAAPTGGGYYGVDPNSVCTADHSPCGLAIGALSGGCGVSDVSSEGEVPVEFALYPPRPNPARSVTDIRFDLPREETVDLRIYDVRGRLVRVLVESETRGPGRHQVTWDGRSSHGHAVGSGIYYLSVRSGTREAGRRLVLLR